MPRDASRDVTVVKLGGSLALSPHRSAWLDILIAGDRPFILVPGGGLFADCVRTSQQVMGFADSIAHHMALLAMGQFGIALAAHSDAFVLAQSRNDLDSALRSRKIPVWLPERLVLGAPDVPACWEVTSDSLAAWLAGACEAKRLLLVKSRDVEANVSVCELATRKIVDPMFPHFAARSPAEVWVAGPGALAEAASILQRGSMPGRMIAMT